MKQKINILIVNVGRRGELIERLKQSGKNIGKEVEIVGCDVSPYAPAFVLCDKIERIAPNRTEKTKKDIISIVKKNSIDLVIPTMDVDFLFLDDMREILEKMGTYILLPKRSTIEIIRDKRKLTKMLIERGINCPKIIKPSSEVLFPVFVKPFDGFGSKNAMKVETYDKLTQLLEENSNLMVTEYIKGEEYTVDCYRSINDSWCVGVSRIRHRVRSGEVSVGTYKNSKLFKHITAVIGESLDIRGPFCYQAFLTKEHKIYVFEVNARFCGGMPVTIINNIPFTDWLLLEVTGNHVDKPLYEEPDGTYFVRMDRTFIFKKPW